ncbi:DNA-binding HxlR family transcriptional regulator [Agromyces hippuratus]|uniref:DNA-binding HxlR family transcriptional regulator n=1 Tax=Agromyces hippuratus TaxID=286438 RepID=A0A852WVY2_9MICO|nr:helix-turn-helix domain-containing protein [Agromyces hippuratus]NYG22246.1 DNA-binding HxlR family transcriptional regulator [Agromyces hippuratus]
MATRGARGFGQYGGVARALERVGDRWALLIVRDLLVGPRRYGDLKAGLPRIPTNILSDRLKELQDSGVVRRVPTVRGGYELTPLGRGLEPVVIALERWGWSVLGEPAEGETVTHDALAVALRAAFRADAAASLPPTEYVLHVADVSVSAIVVGGTLDVVPVGAGALPQPQRRSVFEPVPSAVLELQFDPVALRGVLAGDSAGATVLAGGDELVERFGLTFRIEPVGPPTEVVAAAA